MTEAQKNIFRNAIADVKKAGYSIRDGGFGTNRRCCPVRAIYIANNTDDVSYVEAAHKLLKCSYEDVWSFIYGFDGSAFAGWPDDTSFYDFGKELRLSEILQ